MQGRESTQREDDLIKNNSGHFNDIMKSIAHSKRNLLTDSTTNITSDNTLLVRNKIFSVINTLKPFIVEETFNLIYKYRPEKYCIDKYNTPDLSYIILKINNCRSHYDFNETIRSVKYLNKQGISLLKSLI